MATSSMRRVQVIPGIQDTYTIITFKAFRAANVFGQPKPAIVGTLS